MCDTLFFTGYNRDIRHMPINFRIYGGISLDNMELLGSYENHPYEVRKMIAKFKMSKIRYYTLEILDTDTHQYVAISEMNVGLEFNGKEDTLDKATYYNFQYNKDNLATYGHLIKGNGYLTYNFEGSKFGLYTYQNEECTFIVEIDSIYKEEITLNATNEKKLAYLSEILNNGSHSVKITVLKGNLCVDSFIYA